MQGIPSTSSPEVAHEPTSEVVLETTLRIAPDHPSFAGHFPGDPLLPGVALLNEVLEAVLDAPVLAAFVGPAPRIGAAKFLAPVRPGAVLTVLLTARDAARDEPGPRGLAFEVREGDRMAASGQFEAARRAPPDDDRTSSTGS